ncbi:hypothetical protein EMPS_09426 [Entomortierella parvispora]|uniref:Uncharacterized protein n=1 Tax=Entomortierella parvispora TaxID=205924 RepID=A0A9P3HI58_9FUNG|nr:hypothetical protein EMPS_09426 [Entomortierella parvispora]
MSTLLSQSPITLCNPFSVLECIAARPSNSNSLIVQEEESPIDNKDEDDLDLSSWSVVNSACPSDDDDEDEDDPQDHDDDEIYDGRTTNNTDSKEHLQNTHELATPLTLSNLKDGFTNISKAQTAHSTNSTLSTSKPGTWVLKVNKKKRSQRSVSSSTSNSMDQATQASEKRPMAAMQTASDEDEDEALYMSMTEHELAKSTSASKIKNTRVAIHHGRELARALKCLDEETDKVDKKAIRMRISGKSKSNQSKDRSSLKTKVSQSDDY